MTKEQYLVQGCIDKNINAQRELYELYAAKMLSVCTRYMCDEDEARDAMHDGFVRLFDKIQKFDQKGSFEGWIRKLFVNVCLGKLRISKKVMHESIRYEDDNEMEIIDESISDVYKQLEAKELMLFIRELPKSFRSVFNLHAIEGYSHSEIAKRLGITHSASRAAYFRARVLLKEKIKLMYK
ncbi:MAG: sigma-70 family RNA polymerase sigma factor [Prevotellaceae bacterium]|jgi:RNA polymerase sigma-70 factor (ECF subfamily)|nr:sigma-70 family RNA polymerase sigma factor [Prevotellaceae bacterium]